MANKHKDRTSLPSRKGQIKVRMRSQDTLTEGRAKTRNGAQGRVGRDGDTCTSLVGMPSCRGALTNSWAVSWQVKHGS